MDIIENYDFEDNCIITSQVYEVLKNVKTVYIMSVAYGDITSLKKADSFSIEESNVSQSFINKIHNEGKEVFVWTVNNKSSMEQMIDANVDNIITNNMPLAKRTILKSKTSTIAKKYIKIIEKNF